MTLDDDVAAQLRQRQRLSGAPWKEVVNGALRAGLAAEEATARSHRHLRRTRSVSLGAPKLADLSNVHEVLSLVEGEARR